MQAQPRAEHSTSYLIDMTVPLSIRAFIRVRDEGYIVIEGRRKNVDLAERWVKTYLADGICELHKICDGFAVSREGSRL